MCAKSKDVNCKGCYTEEKLLIEEFRKLVDAIGINEASIREKIAHEVKRIKRFQQSLLNQSSNIKIEEIDIQNYAKFILKEGEIEEKREILSCFNGKILLENNQLSIQAI
jgi:hypothetical protein